MIIFSPHSDDVAFSIGGLLSKPQLPTTKVITVFNKTTYLRDDLKRKTYSKDKISGIRELEDALFARACGLSHCNLDVLDSSLSGYDDYTEIVRDKKVSVLDDPRGFLVYRKVVSSIPKAYKNPIFFPLGLGNHVDHLLLLKVGQKIARDRNLTVVFYEDLPYAADFSEEEIYRLSKKRINPSYVSISYDISAVFDRKNKLGQIYESQICDDYFHGILTHARRVGSRRFDFGERIWMPASHHNLSRLKLIL